jgi:plasmid stabilization system protein ParE
MKAVFLKSAQAELDAAVDYYADHASDRVAEAFLQDTLHTRQRLIEHPEIGKAVSK